MRPCSMTYRSLALAIALLPLASGCDQREAQPNPAATIPAAPSPPPLDVGALEERTDPNRVLQYYAAALASGDWQAAARAWGADSGVTGATLQAEYGGKGSIILQPGTGQNDGACGSLYYTAPVALRLQKANEERTGTITLRQVNNVEGATPEHLRWHIESSTVGPKQ